VGGAVLRQAKKMDVLGVSAFTRFCPRMTG
jgi:hypothetical protein